MYTKNLSSSNPEESPTHVPQPTLTRKARLFRRFIVLTLLFVIVIILFLPKNKPPKPIGQADPIVATVDNKNIHLSEVKKVAREQYSPTAIDSTALQISYDILVERRILDIEAKKLSLSVSNDEIERRISETRIDNSPIPAAIRTTTKYDLLREKIIKTAVKSREAYSISFYIASYEEQKDLAFTAEEKALINRQRLVSKQALNQIEQKLRQGELPLFVAKSILNNYPTLQPVLAVNGYILQSANPEKALENPKIYTYDEYVDQPFFVDVFTLQPEEIKKVEETDGSGGYVIKVKTVNPNGEESYSEWLEKRKEILVSSYNL